MVHWCDERFDAIEAGVWDTCFEEFPNKKDRDEFIELFKEEHPDPKIWEQYLDHRKRQGLPNIG